MDFEPCFKVHNLVSVYPKSIILGQMTNLNMIFHVVVSVYRLVKIWNSPQFPDEFRNGQFTTLDLCLNSAYLSSTCSSSSRTDLLNKSGDYTRRQRTPCSQSSSQRNHQQLKRKPKDTVNSLCDGHCRNQNQESVLKGVYFIYPTLRQYWREQMARKHDIRALWYCIPVLKTNWVVNWNDT